MLPLVVIIGTCNLALGFLLARYWDPPEWLGKATSEKVLRRCPKVLLRSAPRLQRFTALLLRAGYPPAEHAPRDGASAPGEAAGAQTNGEACENRRLVESLPPEWSQALREDALQPQSRLEALLWVMRSAAIANRRAMQILHQRCYRDSVRLDIETECQQASDAWRAKLAEWKKWLQHEHEGVTPSACSQELEQLLTDWMARIDAARTAAGGPFSDDSTADGGRPTWAACEESLGSVQSFREHVERALAALLRGQGKLCQLPEFIQHDRESNALTYLGLQVLFDEWQQRDAERVRMVSGVLIRIDRFAEWRDHHGGVAGEGLAASIGRLLQHFVRKERGFDRVARLNDETFLLFFGDTAVRNAVVAAERIRQSIASASFRLGGQNLSVTISCGVAEWGNTEPPDSWMARLESVLSAARAAGLNQTFAAEGDRIERVAGAQYTIAKREVDVPEPVTDAEATAVCSA